MAKSTHCRPTPTPARYESQQQCPRLALPRPHHPGGSAQLVIRGVQDVCRPPGLLRGPCGPWASLVAATALSWEKWGRQGRAFCPVGTSAHGSSFETQGPRALSGIFSESLCFVGTQTPSPLICFDLGLSTPNWPGQGLPTCSGRSTGQQVLRLGRGGAGKNRGGVG